MHTEGGQGNSCGAQHWCCGAVGIVLCVALLLGVALPVGIVAWQSVWRGKAAKAAREHHIQEGDQAFAAGDYDLAAVAYARAGGYWVDDDLELKAVRARIYSAATRPDLIAMQQVQSLEYDAWYLESRDPGEASTCMVVRGHLSALKGKPEAAQETYKQALEKDRDNLGAHLGLGLQAYKKGKVEDAKKQFKFVLAKAAKHPEALLAMGDLSLASNELDKAKDYYQRSLEVREDPKAHYGLGVTYARQKKYSDAVSELQKALAQNSRYVDAYVALADVYMAAEVWGQAEAALRAALNYTQDASVWLRLAQVLNKQKRYAEAYQIVSPRIQAGLAGPAMVLETARALEGLGQKRDALAQYREVKRLVQKLGDKLDGESKQVQDRGPGRDRAARGRADRSGHGPGA